MMPPFLHGLTPKLYAATLLGAILIDVLTDRTGGAIMLSALPISFIALFTATSGLYKLKGLRTVEFSNWLAGGFLILLVSVYFVTRDPDAAKVGTDIFTYALFVLAPPSSILGASIWLLVEHLPAHPAWLDLFIVWAVSVALGAVQWTALLFIFLKLANQEQRCNGDSI